MEMGWAWTRICLDSKIPISEFGANLKEIDLFVNFKEGGLSLDNTTLSSKKIGDIVIQEGNFVENELGVTLGGHLLPEDCFGAAGIRAPRYLLFEGIPIA